MRWTFQGEVNRDPAFAARLRVNAISDEPRFGGRTPQRLINHSFQRQLPSSRYGTGHPEYYALREGQRLAPFDDDLAVTQPCLTHPGVLQWVTEAVLEDLRADPAAANHAVAQNDNRSFCQCPSCAGLDAREGGPMGSLLTLVNGVADQVGRQHPDVKIGTLAYLHTRRPPAHVRPGPNVQIQLCSIECCQLHPIEDPNCPRNVKFLEDLEAWSRCTDQLYLWNYTTNFENDLLPLPNLRVLGPNLRTFLANGVKGVFMQGPGDGVGTEFSDLRAYVISNLLWDPTRDAQALIDEFLDLHYGAAAPPIRAYLERIHDRAGASGRHQHCFGNLTEYGLDGSDAQAGLEAFGEAVALVNDPEVRERVAKASICAYRAALEPVWSRGDWDSSKRMRPLFDSFSEMCSRFGANRVGEGVDITAVSHRLESLLKRDAND